MNKDIRLSTAFKNHRKRKRLVRALGKGADIYLIDLWLTVAVDCPKGILVGWDEEDIADACGWEEDPKKIVDALIDCNWLEKDSDGEYAIHDWCEHQGWACNAEERSVAARKAADARWNAKRCAPHAPGIDSDAESNAPSPSPLPKDISSEETPDKSFSEESMEMKLAMYLYRHILKRKPDFKEPNLQGWAKHVDFMLRLDKRNPETVKRVVEYCHADPFEQTNVLSTSKLRKRFDQLEMKAVPQTQQQEQSNDYEAILNSGRMLN